MLVGVVLLPPHSWTAATVAPESSRIQSLEVRFELDKTDVPYETVKMMQRRYITNTERIHSY